MSELPNPFCKFETFHKPKHDPAGLEPQKAAPACMSRATNSGLVKRYGNVVPIHEEDQGEPLTPRERGFVYGTLVAACAGYALVVWWLFL